MNFIEISTHKYQWDSIMSMFPFDRGETLQIVSLCLVGTSALFCLLGSAFVAYWCCEYSEEDKKEDKEAGDRATLTKVIWECLT